MTVVFLTVRGSNRPEKTHAHKGKLKGHASLSAVSPILPKQHLRCIMPDTQQTKRARLNLRQPSLTHPSQLVHPAPRNASLQVGQQPKGGKNKKRPVQAQFVKRQKRGGKQGEQKAEFVAWLDTVRDAAEDADEEEPAAEPMDVDQQEAEQQDGQQEAEQQDEQQDEQQGDEQGGGEGIEEGGEKELMRMREVFECGCF